MANAAYARFRAAGLCTGCGSDPRPGKTACQSCADRKSATVAKLRKRHRDAGDTYERMMHLKHCFGLSLEEFDDLLESHNGQCAICKFKFHSEGGRTTAPHVDHDHVTGDVRGLLCGHCNKMIGFARENVETLLNAVSYLQHFQSKE